MHGQRTGCGIESLTKTLVTGATGFTGTNLCRRLILEGDSVVAFVRPTSDIRELLAIGVECRTVDITNLKEVLDSFPDASRVFHIAAAFRVETADQSEFWKVNVEATRNLLDAAKRFKVGRFIHCSTVGVQGEIDDPPANEEYRVHPEDHYQESKLEGERLARSYFAKGLPGSVVRPAGIYGPGDTRFLKLFRSIDKGWFVMIGSGKVFYHMTYIDDLIEGIVLCATREEALGQVFTIAGGEYTTINELANLIAEVLGKPRPRWRVPFLPVHITAILCDRVCRIMGTNSLLYPRRVEFFHKNRAFSIEKAKKLLGYSPRVSLREGLTATAAWYRNSGLL